MTNNVNYDTAYDNDSIKKLFKKMYLLFRFLSKSFYYLQ